MKYALNLEELHQKQSNMETRITRASCTCMYEIMNNLPRTKYCRTKCVARQERNIPDINQILPSGFTEEEIKKKAYDLDLIAERLKDRILFPEKLERAKKLMNNVVTENEHKLNMILRHIKKVEDNCNLLARKMYNEEPSWARQLIQRGRTHDVSKLNDSEFDHLGDPRNFFFKSALRIHHSKNSHHPEFHDILHENLKASYLSDPSNKPEYWVNSKGGIHEMSSLDVAEMVCDCLARSQEFGTDVRHWFFGGNDCGGDAAPYKYNYNESDPVWHLIKKYLDLLLTPPFEK